MIRLGITNDQYLVLQRDIFNVEKPRQMAVLEEVYQMDKKEHLILMRAQKIKELSIIIIGISIVLILLIILGTIILHYYRDKKASLIKLKQLNQDIYEKNEEILTQAEELIQTNSEITRINDSLEEEVSLRVAEVERQSEKLIEYAYFKLTMFMDR